LENLFENLKSHNLPHSNEIYIMCGIITSGKLGNKYKCYEIYRKNNKNYNINTKLKKDRTKHICENTNNRKIKGT
jgi:hypothetical protein